MIDITILGDTLTFTTSKVEPVNSKISYIPRTFLNRMTKNQETFTKQESIHHFAFIKNSEH
jgi:hypothetical protein